MILKGLPVGTKLMWDCKSTLWDFKEGKEMPIHYLYPGIVVDITPKNPLWGVKIKFPSARHWMGNEQENLRLPTEEELKTLTWPEI